MTVDCRAQNALISVAQNELNAKFSLRTQSQENGFYSCSVFLLQNNIPNRRYDIGATTTFHCKSSEACWYLHHLQLVSELCSLTIVLEH